MFFIGDDQIDHTWLIITPRPGRQQLVLVKVAVQKGSDKLLGVDPSSLNCPACRVHIPVVEVPAYGTMYVCV